MPGVNDAWETPQALYDALNREFGFDVDVAADEYNHKAPRYWTSKDDGLAQDWQGLTCFMNPPYGRAIADWVAKAAFEAERGAVVVGLIPCRTDARWWGDVMKASEIRFIKGRVKFGDGTQGAPFPSCIAVWGTPTTPRVSWVAQGGAL